MLAGGKGSLGGTVAEIIIYGGSFVVNQQAGPREGHFGLLGIRERTERLRGQILMHSEPGTGTFVKASIPIIPPAGETPAERPTMSNKSIRILIADDHYVVRMDLAALIGTEPELFEELTPREMEVLEQLATGRGE